MAEMAQLPQAISLPAARLGGHDRARVPEDAEDPGSWAEFVDQFRDDPEVIRSLLGPATSPRRRRAHCEDRRHESSHRGPGAAGSGSISRRRASRFARSAVPSGNQLVSPLVRKISCKGSGTAHHLSTWVSDGSAVTSGCPSSSVRRRVVPERATPTTKEPSGGTAVLSVIGGMMAGRIEDIAPGYDAQGGRRIQAPAQYRLRVSIRSSSPSY